MKSIKTKLVLAFSSLILAIAVIVGAISILNGYLSLKEEAQGALELLAAEGSKTTQSRMETLITVLELIAKEEEIVNMGWEADITALSNEGEKTDYLDIGYVLPNGYTYYTDGTVRLMSDRSYIKKALSGQPGISDVVISRVTRKPEIEVAVPVYKNGEITGALVGRREADSLGSIIRDIKYKEKGYAFMINEEGTMIANQDTELVLSRFNPIKEMTEHSELSSISTAFQAILTKKSGTTSYRHDDTPYYVGFAPIENTQWTFVIVADQQEVLSVLPKTVRTIIITISCVFLIGMGVVYLLDNSITRPLTMMTNHSRKIADLDISMDIDEQYLKQRDEVGTLSEAFQLLTNRLREIILQITDTSDTVNQTAQMISQASSQSLQASNELSHTVEMIAKEATEQAKDTELGVRQASELDTLIDSHSLSMADLKQSSLQVVNLVDNGLLKIEYLSDITRNNETVTKEICEIIMETKKSSEQIRVASSIISEIARQSKLLSFNATIEAARMGDAGNGFAIVAEEMNHMAEQSTESAKYIDEIIERLHLNIINAVDSMERIQVTSQEQNHCVYDVIDRYKAITASIHTSIEATKRLDEAFGSMNQVKKEMLDMLMSLSAIAQHNAAGTQQASASMQQQISSAHELALTSEQMTQLADELRAITARFTIESQAGRESIIN